MFNITNRLLQCSCFFILVTSATPLALHHGHEQMPLQTTRFPRPTSLPGQTSYLDPTPNSVALLLSTPKQEAVKLWLPLRQCVYTRDAPELPVHPYTAEIATIVPSAYSIEEPALNSVKCTIYPRVERLEDGRGAAAGSEIEISRADGKVQLEFGSLKFWLGGREVEAYECG